MNPCFIVCTRTRLHIFGRPELTRRLIFSNYMSPAVACSRWIFPIADRQNLFIGCVFDRAHSHVADNHRSCDYYGLHRFYPRFSLFSFLQTGQQFSQRISQKSSKSSSTMCVGGILVLHLRHGPAILVTIKWSDFISEAPEVWLVF